MMTTSERATQKSMTRPRRSVHHTNFLWALCQEFVLSTTQRLVAFRGAGLPFVETSAPSPISSRRPGGPRIVAAVEVDARALRHQAERSGGFQGGYQ